MAAERSPILIVDDDPSCTALLTRVFEEAGHATARLHDSRRAVDELIAHSHRIVILDIDMPHLDGLALLRRIKALDGGVLAIMLTGEVTMATVLESMRAGAEACFFKPIKDFEPLLAAVADAQRKIERWWMALANLKQLRAETGAPVGRVQSQHRLTPQA